MSCRYSTSAVHSISRAVQQAPGGLFCTAERAGKLCEVALAGPGARPRLWRLWSSQRTAPARSRMTAVSALCVLASQKAGKCKALFSGCFGRTDSSSWPGMGVLRVLLHLLRCFPSPRRLLLRLLLPISLAAACKRAPRTCLRGQARKITHFLLLVFRLFPGCHPQKFPRNQNEFYPHLG
jgi:hypothetical protein